jgi:sporulation protein YlmC with PRC-barrel domain
MGEAFTHPGRMIGTLQDILFDFKSNTLHSLDVMVGKIAGSFKGLWNLLLTNPIAQVVAGIALLVAGFITAY